MKKLTFILFFILSVPLIVYSFFHHRYDHELAVCAIFKNEAPYFKEWIDYHHHILGATHFYLYNNDSSDNYREVLRPYIKEGLVEVIDWKTCEQNTLPNDIDPILFYRIQRGAYNDCLKKRALGKARWVAVIDIDEFIVPVKGVRSFKKLLKQGSNLSLELLKNRFTHVPILGCFKLNWLVFGTSNVWDIEGGELLTEKLFLRAPDNHKWHRHTKCIYRPEAIDFCRVHHAVLIDKYKHIKLEPSKFRINHYWSGPEKRLIEKRKLSDHKLKKFIKEYNVIEDKSIFMYLPKLKQLSSEQNHS